MVLIFLKLNLLHPSLKDAFEASLISIGPVVLEEKIFKFQLCIFTIRFYLLLERGVTLHLNKRASPLLKDTLFQVWLKWRQISLINSRNFVIISH